MTRSDRDEPLGPRLFGTETVGEITHQLGIVGAQLVDPLSMARTEFDDRVAIDH
jgi:hypothetical protein